VLVTTDRAIAETRRRIDLGLKRPELQSIVDALVAEMTVVPVAALAAFLSEAAVALTDAVASRNGSNDDAHLLALAWSVDAGVASWSTPNLIRGLALVPRNRD
jgi:hypothetical protein